MHSLVHGQLSVHVLYPTWISWVPMGPVVMDPRWGRPAPIVESSWFHLGSISDPWIFRTSVHIPSLECSIPRRWRVNHEGQRGRTENSRVSKRAHRKHMGVKAVAPYTQECQKRSHRKLMGVKMVAPYAPECQNGRTVYT